MRETYSHNISPLLIVKFLFYFKALGNNQALEFEYLAIWGGEIL